MSKTPMSKTPKRFYAKSIPQTLEIVQSTKDGLSTIDVEERLTRHGKNLLPTTNTALSKLSILVAQFKSTLMIILILAGVISGILGEYVDMSVILFTALFNIVIGYFQENKANQSLKKLREMVTYKVLALRDGKKQLIESAEIVVGDILFLEAGDKIQADARIIESVEFSTDESALTGESTMVHKSSVVLKDADVGVGDRTNMVFSSTAVTSGRAIVAVTSIGLDTEIGKIASLVKDTKDEATPLQNQLERMSKGIAILVFFISLFVFVVGLIFTTGDSHHTLQLFETAVAIAVAAIPEGLVISLTVILAIGMSFILKKKALVRRLVAAETLGSVSVICTDKTGTITEGIMKLSTIATLDNELRYTELLSLNSEEQKEYKDVIDILKASIHANDGILQNPEADESDWTFVGDTTDTALIDMGIRMGFTKDNLEKERPRINELSFTSERKYMATLHSNGKTNLMFMKGAADVLIKKCEFALVQGKKKKLTKKLLEQIEKSHEHLTRSGLRVLAIAQKTHSEDELDENDLEGLTFLGLVALADPLRDDVVDTLELAAKAGIRTVMITGDHVQTAKAIAKQIGLPYDDNSVFDGHKLSSISDKELQIAVGRVHIFARVDPIHKIRIVKAFQANGEIVAMTGDGVNDAPAIKGADIGVALGSGTAVAKETADMVLVDDAFSTIVAAVEEGRTIYQNIKKVILYLLSGSFAVVVLIVGSMIAGLPLAALPAQILWINLIEDAFPNMALAFDKGDHENMTDPPRKKTESIIDKEMKTMIIAKSILSNIVLFLIFLYMWNTTQDIKLTRTIVFLGFGIDSLFYIFSIRSLRKMIWKIPLFNNLYLILAVAFSWSMLLLAIYWPPLQLLLQTVPLEPHHWILMIGFAMLNVLIMEIIKAIFIIKRQPAT